MTLLSLAGQGRRLVAGLALLALGVLVGHGPLRAQPASIEHVRGTTTLAAVPRKVIVFDLAALDVLDALGIPVAGVPSGPKPAYLAKYNDAKYPKMGSLFEPDYEAVAAAAPDLIVAGMRSSPKVDELAKIAPTIDVTVDAADLVGSAKRHSLALAGLFGKENEAKARLATIDAEIAAVRAKASTAGTGLILLTTGGRVSAFGSGSRFGVVHDSFGVKPAAPEIKVGLHGQPISFEFIRKVDPDWLFVLDRDAAIDTRGQPSKQLLDNELVRETKAWKKNQVVYLESASFYLAPGGLSGLKAMVDQFAKAFGAAR